MIPDCLYTHFDRIADSPNAVPRLRRFILDLAVRGKLVPQDPNDEPAAELLIRIALEKDRLSNTGRKRARQYTDLSPNSLSYELPSGWSVAKFADIITELQTGPFGSSLHRSDYDLGKTPVINPASMQEGKIVPIDKMAVASNTLDRLAKYKLEVGDIVMARRGEMGRCAVVSEQESGWLCGTGSLIIRLPKCVNESYLAMLMRSPFVRKYLDECAVGATMQNLNQSILLKMSIGLPPLAEQHRIVVKVGELMSLCDRLKDTREKREAARTRFVTTSLARLRDPEPDPSTFHAHVVFAVNNLDRLTTRTDQIKALRRTILDLAVRGKLVPQDPNEGTASALLNRIAEQKMQMVEKWKIRKPREYEGSETPIPIAPFAIPSCWQWVRLDAVGTIVGGGTPDASDSKNFADTGTGFPWLTPADLGRNSQSYISRGRRDLTEQGIHASSATLMPTGTVLFTSRAPIGYVAVAANPISTNQGFKSLVPYEMECSRFIAIVLTAFGPRIDESASGTTFKEVSGRRMAGIPCPVPPLAEQHRIVAKVDELVALCDRVEISASACHDLRYQLLNSLLHEAIHSAPTTGLTRRPVLP